MWAWVERFWSFHVVVEGEGYFVVAGEVCHQSSDIAQKTVLFHNSRESLWVDVVECAGYVMCEKGWEVGTADYAYFHLGLYWEI